MRLKHCSCLCSCSAARDDLSPAPPPTRGARASGITCVGGNDGQVNRYWCRWARTASSGPRPGFGRGRPEPPPLRPGRSGRSPPGPVHIFSLAQMRPAILTCTAGGKLSLSAPWLPHCHWSLLLLPLAPHAGLAALQSSPINRGEVVLDCFKKIVTKFPLVRFQLAVDEVRQQSEVDDTVDERKTSQTRWALSFVH